MTNIHKSLLDIIKSGEQNMDKFKETFENMINDANTRTVITKIGDKTYTSIIGTELDIDVANEFPTDRPDKDDVYWKEHTRQVEQIINIRKELLMKMIETAGSVAKGFIPGAASNG